MCRRQGCWHLYRGAGLHHPAPECVARKAADQARELASAETLALARPISSQTSIAHPTTTRNTYVGRRSGSWSAPEVSMYTLFVMAAIVVTFGNSDTNTSNPPCPVEQTKRKRTPFCTGHQATSQESGRLLCFSWLSFFFSSCLPCT